MRITSLPVALPILAALIAAVGFTIPSPPVALVFTSASVLMALVAVVLWCTPRPDPWARSSSKASSASRR